MTDPRRGVFWQNEQRLLWSAVEPLAMAALLAGAEGAARLLPAEIAPLVNWDFFNESAIRYLSQYRLDTVAGITDTTRRQAIAAIEDWMRSGAKLDALRMRLRPLFGETRADMIAITEVTRTFAEGNLRLWASTGVVGGKRWMTAVDERVCPVCAPLHGRLVQVDAGFGYTASELESEVLRKALGHVGSEFNAPPAHPRCRCWLQPVVSEEMLREQVGDILAREFFAKVEGREDLFIAYGANTNG